MASLLAPGEKIMRWRIVRYLKGSNALSYVAEFCPADTAAETRRLREELRRRVREFDPDKDQVFLKQFNDPSYRDIILKPFAAYQDKIHSRIKDCWKKCNCFCRELDSFIFEEPKPGKRGYYQVQEFYPECKSMKDCLEKDAGKEKDALSWTERLTHAKMMTYGLMLLHAAGIVHADLKPDNLLVVANRRPDGGLNEVPTALRIIDFDSSLLTDEPSPRHKLSADPANYRYRGTEQYLSPEHFGGKVPEPASDIFTAAIILCEMLSPDGHPFPYEHEQYRDAVKKGKCNLTRLHCKDCQSTVDTLKACFSMNPGERPDATQLLRELKKLPVKL
jgi:serine/threonine protein kinase